MSSIKRGVAQPDEDQIEREVTLDETSVYADMKDLLGTQVEDNIIELPVISRQRGKANLHVRFNATFDYDQLNRWMKQATTRKKLDPKNLALIVLHNTCIGFVVGKMVDGKEVKTEFKVDGQPQTFDSSSVQEMVGTMGGWSGAIIQTYSNDGHMLLVMNRIIEEAGYSAMDLEDAEGYDPLAR